MPTFRGTKRARAMQSRGSMLGRFKPSRANKRRRLTKVAGIPRVITNAMGLLSSSSSRIVTLRFSKQFSLTPAVDTVDSQGFRINSCFAPDPATSNQPRGFDQYTAMYDHFEVLSVGWDVAMCSTATGSTLNPSLCGTYLKRDNTALSDSESILEEASSAYQLVEYSQRGIRVRGKADIAKTLGIQLPNSRLVGSKIGDPSEQIFMHVFCLPTDTTGDPTNVAVTLRLDMRVKFREAIAVPASL